MTQLLVDAVKDAVSAAQQPVIGRGDAERRIAEAFASARAERTQALTDVDEARSALLALGVVYEGGETITCHGMPLIVPEAGAPWAACQRCGNRYGLMALARLAPLPAAKGGYGK